MLSRSQLPTVLVAFMLAFSMVAMAAPTIAEEDGPNDEVYTLENDEGVYLVFGADLNGQSLEEYIESHADAEDGDDVDVVEYTDVGEIELVQEGQATSVSIDGGEATALQDANQYNANAQIGEATAESYEADSYSAVFEDVGEVTMIFGNGEDQSFDGYAIGDGDDISVSQEATAMVAQAQAVNQGNVNEQTALAYAENGSDALAVQHSQQSNMNLQEGAANATNVLAAALAEEDKKDKKDKKHDDHKKDAPDHGVGIDADQDADATVVQDQNVDQFNVNEQSAVAIAVGDDSTATAIQMTEQTNLNEQVGTAEAVNVLMQQAGMNVATAGGDADFLDKNGEKVTEPKDKKSDKDDRDVTQTAEASVTQVQSVNQTNLNEQSAAFAVAINGSEATAVQMTFQQNINAQMGSADALNIMDLDIEDAEKKHDTKHDGKYDAGHHFDGVTVTNTTSAVLEGDGVAGGGHFALDYDGDGDQRNAVEQWSNAEVEQSQDVDQVNLNQQGAIAIAEDEGNASSVQISIQENENIQFASAESTSVVDAELVDEDEKKDDVKEDEKKDDVKEDEKKDDEKDDDAKDEPKDSEASTETTADDERKDDTADDEMPGFGVLVAIAALAVAGASRVVSQR